MRLRQLGRTGLMVSEIGLGGEWLEKQDTKAVVDIMHAAHDQGINIVDCWMSEPNVRSNIGEGMKGCRGEWMVQGQIGSTWQCGQYVKTRDLQQVKPAFEDLLTRMKTDYMDLGMIHYVDSVTEFDNIMNGPFWTYVEQLRREGRILHTGLSTHNPLVGQAAVKSGAIEMLLFSINPAFDLMPASEDLNDLFAEEYKAGLCGIDPEREKLYRLCESENVGITVMKGFAGGRLFSAQASPFGVALTPVQCLHYALTRPAVASVLVGFSQVSHVYDAVAYETATDEEKDYASVLANAPKHAFTRGQCTYCGHCAPCPAKIDIAMVNKLADLAKMQPSVPASVKAHYMELEHRADDCIGCKGCETRCPFGVPVAQKMQETKELFA